MGEGSPSKVARKLFSSLLLNKDKLPFDDIKIFSKIKHSTQLSSTFKDSVEVLTYKSIRKINQDDMVHIPVLPTILPNEKFLLYMFSRYVIKCNVIVQYHGDVRKELKSSYKDVISLLHILTYTFLNPLLKSCDTVITHSYYMENTLKEYGVMNTTVIPNGIDDYWFSSANDDSSQDSRGINKDNINLFYHGRISWEKGIDMLIESFFLFQKTHEHSSLYIAGDGPQKSELIHLCNKLNISDKVDFLNNLSPDKIKYYLSNVDIAIYPSRFDNFPLAVLEAFACAECPVFFSKNIGIYDFVMKSGLKLGSFEANTKSIKAVIDTSSSYHREVVTSQKNFASNYLWDSVITEYIAAYNKVISSSRT